MDDFCYYCDGTGERDFLSGAKCYECNGTGWVDRDDEPELTYQEQDELDEFYSREADRDYENDRQQGWKQP